MKQIILILIFSIILLAKTPDVYSALGDVIYNNVKNIENLKKISSFKKYENKINNYALRVKGLKKMGFSIESGDIKIDKLVYLQKLRELSKINDFFIISVTNSFKASIKKQDNKLFFEVINSGLLDIKRYKPQIKEYYLSHSNDVNITGVIQKYIEIDLPKKKKTKSKALTKKEKQAAKIKRIREKDRLKQEAIKKSLEDETKRKKIKIREEQKRELKN